MSVILTSKDELIEIVKNAVESVINSKRNQSEKPPSQLPEILTIEQASKLLNLAKPTIYTLTSKAKIPHFKKGKKLYFKRSELLQWIEQGKQKTVAEEQREMDEYLLNKSKNR